MIPLPGAAFVVAMICIVGAIFWIKNRIEAHIRTRHPLLVNEIFPPPPPIGPGDTDERTSLQSLQMFSFMWSGRAKGLRDPALDRLILIYRLLLWLFGACAAAFFAHMYFTRMR